MREIPLDPPSHSDLKPCMQTRGQRQVRETGMKAVQVTDDFWVAPQLSADDMQALSKAGITTLINNRPDGEEPGQPSGAELERAAAAAGLAMHHVPLGSAGVSEELIRDFQAAKAKADGPVLAHCRSGTRSLTLWVLGEVLDGRMQAEDVIGFGRSLGYDLTGAQMWLARRAAG